MAINTCRKIAVNGGTIYRLSVIYIGDGLSFVERLVGDMESKSTHLRFHVCGRTFCKLINSDFNGRYS